MYLPSQIEGEKPEIIDGRSGLISTYIPSRFCNEGQFWLVMCTDKNPKTTQGNS